MFVTKKWLAGSLLCLGLLAGCSSNGDSNFVFTGTTVAAPAPLSLTNQTASRVVSTMLRSADVDFLAPVDASVEGRESLPLLNPSHPSSSALAAASGLFLLGPGRHTSPLGGSVEITSEPGGLKATFVHLDTLVGTLDGTIRVLGEASLFSAEFIDFVIASKDSTATLRGPASYSRSQDEEGTEVVWTANYELQGAATTPPTSRASLQFEDFQIASNFALGAGTIEGSKSYQGTLVMQGHGLSGSVRVTTTTPFRFSGPFTQGTSTLTVSAGALTITGSGALTLTVGKDGGVALAGPDGKVIKTVPWAYLGGSIDASNLLRPLVADSIFQNATMLTINSQQPNAEALASMDGRLLAVGTQAEVANFREASTRLVDLKGQTVLPGFVEVHMHTNLTALDFMSNVTPLVVNTGTYDGLNSKAKSLVEITKAVNSTPDAAAVLGYGFDPSRMIPADLLQPLSLAELDAISPTVPIVIQNSSGHISYANSAAFRETGVWPTAPNAPFTAPQNLGTNVVIDENGLPTGQLNEFAQSPFLSLGIEKIIVPLSAQFVEQFFAVLQSANGVGITTAGDQLLGGVLGLPVEEGILSRLALTHSPPVRLSAYLASDSIQPLTSNVFAGEGDDSFRIRGAKFVTDGSTQGFTAALNFDYPLGVAPYLPGPPNGTLDIPDTDALLAQVKAWHNLGFQISTHANGDRAQDQILDVYSRLDQTTDARFLLHHFTAHLDGELDAQVSRVKALGVYVSMTIGHVYYWGEVFNNTILGPDIAKNIDPAASLLAAEVPISFHSDSPITPLLPLRYIETAVTRLWQTPPRQVLGPEERITREQAIRVLTLGAAEALFMEKKVGSLEVGKYTDLVVLGGNPLLVDVETISEIPVIGTYVSGVRITPATP